MLLEKKKNHTAQPTYHTWFEFLKGILMNIFSQHHFFHYTFFFGPPKNVIQILCTTQNFIRHSSSEIKSIVHLESALMITAPLSM